GNVMFCTKCGTQNPDGAAFCVKCGTQLAASAPVELQSGKQPISQPLPDGAQPAKKSKTMPMIIGICGALLAAFLVVLFTVILPKTTVKGKLRHSWTREDGSYTETYDFAHNEYRYGYGDFRVANGLGWSVDGDVLLIITYPFADMPDVTRTTSYKVSFGSEDRVVTLTNVDDPANVLTFTRDD
ncbi:MAG: zinc-ribbon domain-containing protein, partial [Oscillospiraceae bacterium]|nr:zinc-ribbon domain-containing protein [Oscillospiraceae bacterium]